MADEIMPLVEGTSLRESQTVIGNNFDVLARNAADTTPPANPVTGQLWYDTTGPALKVYNGATWDTIYP